MTERLDFSGKTCIKKAQPPYWYGGVEAQYPGYHSCTFRIVKSISINYSLVVLGIFLVKGGTYPLLWPSLYYPITETFVEMVERQAFLKKKFVSGNQAPFIKKELRKAICSSSRLRNDFCKHPTRGNEVSYKKQRNKCVSLRKIVSSYIFRIFQGMV